jgi:tetratricopeptide (TPR) repeat protein
VNVDSEDSIAKIDPQATEFYKMVDQAFVLARNNHLPEAIEMLRSALQRDPDDAMAHFNLANLLNATQQSGDALAEFRKASALNPEETTFLESLGMSLEMNGRRDEALVKLRKAADLDPTSAAFVFNLGSVMEWNGDYAGALGALEKASKLSDSNNLRIEFGLAKPSTRPEIPQKPSKPLAMHSTWQPRPTMSRLRRKSSNSSIPTSTEANFVRLARTEPPGTGYPGTVEIPAAYRLSGSTGFE